RRTRPCCRSASVPPSNDLEPRPMARPPARTPTRSRAGRPSYYPEAACMPPVALVGRARPVKPRLHLANITQRQRTTRRGDREDEETGENTHGNDWTLLLTSPTPACVVDDDAAATE